MTQQLGKYEFDVGSDVSELDLDALIPISDDLNKEFSNQAATYAYVAMLGARSEAVWRDSKNELEKASAVAYKRSRERLEANNTKVTESMVNSDKLLRPEYMEAVEYEIGCHEQYLVFRVLTRSFEQRAQMLISLGAHLRSEAEQTGMLIADVKRKLRDIPKNGVARNGNVDSNAG